MSAYGAEELFGVPPVRGGVSILALMGLGYLPFELERADLSLRIAIAAVIVLMATYIWAWTLQGLVRDLMPPRDADGSTLLAYRPHPAATVIAPIALVLGVITTVWWAANAGSDQAVPGSPSVTAATAVLGLGLATALPRLSRRSTLCSGTVAARQEGLLVTTERSLEPRLIPYDTIAADPSAADAALGPQVRWRPGAREAVARWAVEGFAPTYAEVRALGLDGRCSPDPRAWLPTVGQRLHEAGQKAYFAVIMGVMTAAIVYAGTDPSIPWWSVVLFGGGCLLLCLFFLFQAVTALRGPGLAGDFDGS